MGIVFFNLVQCTCMLDVELTSLCCTVVDSKNTSQYKGTICLCQ